MRYYIPFFILFVSCHSSSDQEEVEELPEIVIEQTKFDSDIEWNKFEASVFDRAQEENKLVF